MISIDRLRLTLPAGFDRRADAVARRVVEELAGLPQADSRRLARLTLPPMTLDPRLGDREIARRIATAIHERLNAPDAGGETGTDAGRATGPWTSGTPGGARP
jgi:hypothetical protein